MSEIFTMELAGRKLSLETGKVAKQASGAVMVRYGDTVVLTTATASQEPREGIDFFPLTVDYEEKMYAVGKIPGGFIKREGRPSEKAILASRLTDRPIRPLFPEGFRNDVQIVSTVLSVDQDNSPEICSIIGASAALSISDIPFYGPIGAVVVGLIDDELVINPTIAQQSKSKMHISVAASGDAVVMVEAGADEVSEDIMLKGIMYGFEVIQSIINIQTEMVKAVGKEKREIRLFEPSKEMESEIREFVYEKLKIATQNLDKLQRESDTAAVKEEMKACFIEKYPDSGKEIGAIFYKLLKEVVRKNIIINKLRPDGRALDEIRPIWCETGVLPRTHGSAIFTRGQTQALTIATLGSLDDTQTLDGLGAEESKRYMHQYNFPAFSVGETKPLRGPGRREIGHGALAERALLPMIPDVEDFPYAIRVVSEILESNGSTSQASVCGSTLALMDAGVPIKSPVAGVAMGLVKDGDEVAILTDIQGVEDALGDMDFKVAGTKQGITAIQMDIKVRGLTKDILQEALAQANKGRMFILGKMLEVLEAPRAELSQYAPRIFTIEIDPDKIRDIIGPGGKVIRKIVEETGVKIDIEDDGKVYLAAVDFESAEKAIKWIESITKDVQVGEVYTGKVTRLMNFGVFVELLPGKEGMVHISQLAKERVAKVEDVVKVGDIITVKVMEIDKQGRVNLSRKATMLSEEPQSN